MNVDEAIRRLGQGEGLPREALQWSLDHWDEASPRLIARLRAVVNHPDPVNRGDEDLSAAFLILHLSAEKRDWRAYVPLCHLIAADAEFEDWFNAGDLNETLSGVLINLFDGDVEPLKSAIESPQGGVLARVSALHALCYLTRSRGVLSDEEMRAYLMTLRKQMAPREKSFIWTGWALAVAYLGYELLRGEVGRLFSAGWIRRDSLELEEFHAMLALSRRDPDGLAAFHHDGVEPFGVTIETFAEGGSEFENEEEGEDPYAKSEAADAGMPFVDPLRDVGRNDPCPCGSGKKYKKCCLAA